MAAYLICLIVGYFCGCISTGYFVGKFYHMDIRTKGSGNAGTTNVLRNLGKLPALWYRPDFGSLSPEQRLPGLLRNYWLRILQDIPQTASSQFPISTFSFSYQHHTFPFRCSVLLFHRKTKIYIFLCLTLFFLLNILSVNHCFREG